LIELTVSPVQALQAGVGVAVYFVMVPPLSAGAVHDSATEPFPGVPATPVGAAGGVSYVTLSVGCTPPDSGEPAASHSVTVGS
jgi:hypothetical protein